MTYIFEEKHLKDLLSDACEIGFKKGLMTGSASKIKIKPYMSKREAHRLYGRAIVDRWIKEGLIKEIKDGENSSTVRIDRIQIDIVAKSSNRSSFLTTEERKTAIKII